MIDLQADPSTWQAGREFDATVAKAMGWKNVRQHGSGITKTVEWGGTPPGLSHDAWRFVPVFTPKSIISPSWDGMRLMVEWIIARGASIEIEIYSDVCGAMIWYSDGTDYSRGMAPTAPLAVARALLVYNGR